MEESNANNIENLSDCQIEIANLSFIYESTYKKFKKENSKEVTKNGTDNDLNQEKIDNSLLEKIKVLRKINLKIEKGKFIALCGNTGCGKSTFVRTFNGLIPHFYSGLFYGFVKVLGKDTIQEKISDLSMHVGLVFQNPENQLVAMTVEREIAFGLENRGVLVDKMKKKMEYILKYLHIEHLKKRHPYELSGGEQQRVAIASILTLEPDIIILDEPTSTLDPKAAIDVINLLKKINRENNITIIIIEHRLDMILPYCDEIILMQNGKTIQHESVENVLNSDLIYQINVQVPEYIEFFYELKKLGLYNGSVPKNIEGAAKIIEELMTK